MRNGKYAARRTSGTKAFALMLALILVVGAAVGTTLAWLTAESGTVTNTFTVGKITIELKEHQLVDGSLNSTEVTGNSNYKIVPGGEQPKDPFVTVKSGSEKCYVYVKVENTMKIGNAVVATPNIDTTDDWAIVETQGNATLYRYKGTLSTSGVVDANSKDVKLPVFTKVSYDGKTITEANIGSLATGKIELKAYAHQSDNTDVNTADTAAKAWAFPEATT